MDFTESKIHNTNIATKDKKTPPPKTQKQIYAKILTTTVRCPE